MDGESEDLGDFDGDLLGAVEGRGFAGEDGIVRDPELGLVCFCGAGGLTGSGDTRTVGSEGFSAGGELVDGDVL